MAAPVGAVRSAGEESTVLDSAMEIAGHLALNAFPTGTVVKGSDDVDEDGGPLKLMTVSSPGSIEATHTAYLAFMRSWVRSEPPEHRRRIRVSCSASST